MKQTYIEFAINDGDKPINHLDVIRLNPGANIARTTFGGPLFLDRNARMGPEVKIGRYCSLGENSLIARSTIGSFCAMAAHVTVNPFNHPMDWLSIHEFQFRGDSYDWVPEYREVERLERTPDMFRHVEMGSDIWLGANVTIMGGVTIGTGAIVGAGSIVTRNVPPYAVVVGQPATVKRLRFDDAIVERLLASKWWELDLSDLSGLPFRDVERSLDRIEEVRARKSVAAT